MNNENERDYLVRVITKDANVRGLACVTSRLVNEACGRHGAYPTACAALGRALTGGALMGALLKTGQRVALRFEGNGPLGKILKERVESALVSLGREELEKIVEEQGHTDVRCEFCLESYHLTRQDLMRLLQ